MKNKKILIAGGGGYIGTVLSPYLAGKGYDVTVVDTFWFGNNLPDTVTYIKSDLFELKVDDLKGYDQLIFLAGLSNDPMAEFAPQENFVYNCALPAYLGFIAREAGVKRMLFASSCSVYGYTQNTTFTEGDATVCNYPYGVSKLQGEQSVLALGTEDFSVICLRQGTVSGYSPRMRLDLAVNTMFKNALLCNTITLSNHRIWRPILALPDLCRAYLAAAESDPGTKGVFNIASFNNTVGELAQAVAARVNKELGLTVSITDQNIQDYRNYKVSWEKAHAHFGYEPQQTLDDIITELISHLDAFKDLENKAYYNIDVFKSIHLDQHRIFMNA